jgi:hypothetical protein
MFIPAWAVRTVPYIGGLLLAVAAYVWAYGNGRDTEREKWQVEQALAADYARERENLMQAQIDAAAIDLSAKQAEIDRLMDKSRVETRNYYVTNPAANLPCLLPERLRSIAESDAAAQGATTAGQRAQ